MGCSVSQLHMSTSKVQPDGVSVGNKKRISKVQPSHTPVTGNQNGSVKVQPDEAIQSGNIPTILYPQSVPDESGLVYHDQTQQVSNLVALCKKGKIAEVCELLSVEGTDVNIKGMWSNTPLVVACQYGHSSIAQLLLQQPDVDLNHSNDNGATALLFACMEGLRDVVDKLIYLRAFLNPPATIVYNSMTDKSDYMTPLSAAVVNGHLDIVDALLSSGCDINADIQQKNDYDKDSSTIIRGVSVLMLACKYQRLNIIQILLLRGADPRRLDSTGCSVIHYACRSGSAAHKVLAALFENSSIPPTLMCAPDHNNNCGLHIACENKSIGAAEILLNSSLFCSTSESLLRATYVNTVNSSGLSPLHIAIKKRSYEIVKLLLDNEADPHVKQIGGDKVHPSAYEMVLKLRSDSDIYKLVVGRYQTATKDRPTSPSSRGHDQVSSDIGSIVKPSADTSPEHGDQPECSDYLSSSPQCVEMNTTDNMILQTPQKTPNRQLDDAAYSRITSAPKKDFTSAEKDTRPPSPVTPIQL